MRRGDNSSVGDAICLGRNYGSIGAAYVGDVTLFVLVVGGGGWDGHLLAI